MRYKVQTDKNCARVHWQCRSLKHSAGNIHACSMRFETRTSAVSRMESWSCLSQAQHAVLSIQDATALARAKAIASPLARAFGTSVIHADLTASITMDRWCPSESSIYSVIRAARVEVLSKKTDSGERGRKTGEWKKDAPSPHNYTRLCLL